MFDIVAFGEEAFSDVMRMNFENARRLYRDKLLPPLEEELGESAALGEAGNGPAHADAAAVARRRSFRTDDRLMKTVLLAALVPEVESLKNLTGERLAALNHESLKTPIPGQEKSQVIQRFRRWAGRVGEIRPGGDSANPVISMQLTGVDTESILVQAQAEDNRGNRQLMIRRHIFDTLDVKTPDLSMSRDIREETERAFRDAEQCCIVCTSSLELGLDVGNLDLVLQLDAPSTVSAFLQHLGRTGRRSGTKGHLSFVTDCTWSFLQAVALVRLAAKGQIEPITPSERAVHIFLHQVLARVLQHGGVGRHRLVDAWGPRTVSEHWLVTSGRG